MNIADNLPLSDDTPGSNAQMLVPDAATEHGDVGHVCGCNDDEGGHPELDARVIPHAIRHATVFGALSAVDVGGALILIAPHDPLPLLAQAADLFPDMFSVEYLQRGPDAWRLQFTRAA